jgi:hypothetical protein
MARIIAGTCRLTDSLQRRPRRTRSNSGEPSANEPDVRVTLTSAQVAHIAGVAAGAGDNLASMFAGLEDPETRRVVAASLTNMRLSNSALRAVLILGSFPCDGTERTLAEVADELGISRSTTHRYLATWKAIRLLEQDPQTRRYRRAAPSRRPARSRPGN